MTGPAQAPTLPTVCDNLAMPRQFEFADSEISHIRSTPEGCSIDFSAAMITEMVQGQASRSFSNGLRLVLRQISATTAPQVGGFGLLAAGMLHAGDHRHSALPVPSHFGAESMALHLQFADGQLLELRCQSLRCEATEEAQEVEVLAC
ncbi:hypothetical protein GCM10027276_01070 [Comamonas piscis]